MLGVISHVRAVAEQFDQVLAAAEVGQGAPTSRHRYPDAHSCSTTSPSARDSLATIRADPAPGIAQADPPFSCRARRTGPVAPCATRNHCGTGAELTMDQDLVDAFTRVLQNSSPVGGNPYLPLLRQTLQEVAADDGAELDGARTRLRELLSDPYMGLDPGAAKTFIENLGEAHFHVVAGRVGVDLVKLPENRNEKTPDFLFSGDPDVYFEVKTPSVVDGEFHFKRDIEHAWQARLAQQARLDEGRRIAFSEREIMPYDEPPDDNLVRHATTVLQEKIRGNLKPDQFAKGRTYLVCSLLVLHPYGGTTDGMLSRLYQGRSSTGEHSPVSGHLWMTAFSAPEMPVRSEREFEDLAGNEDRIGSVGILVGDAHDFVEGIVFLVYDLNGYSHMCCLVRSLDQLAEPLLTLVGRRWNDHRDSNRRQLGGIEDDAASLLE